MQNPFGTQDDRRQSSTAHVILGAVSHHDQLLRRDAPVLCNVQQRRRVRLHDVGKGGE